MVIGSLGGFEFLSGVCRFACMEGRIQTRTEGKVVYITFYHPSANALPLSLLEGLANTIEEVAKEEGVHVLVVQSEGKVFCAGASFDELLAVGDFEGGKRFFSGFAKVINAMRSCGKPVVGRIQGKAVGGGVGLIAAMDYVVASQKAALRLSELAIGIGPFVIAPAVKRKIGVKYFGQMALTPTRWYDAQWCKQVGFFDEVVEPSALDEAVKTFVAELSGYSIEALMALKEELWKGTAHWDTLLYEQAEISARLVLTAYTRAKLRELKAKQR